MPYVRVLLILVMLLSFLTACGGSPEPPMSEATMPDGYPSILDAYPDPVAPTPVSYPSQEDDDKPISTEPFIIPSPSADQVGNVTGRLFRVTEGRSEPIRNTKLFLGTILQSQEGVEGLVQLNRGIDPEVTTDDQGNFVFVDIQPGRYGLMIDTATSGALLLNQPDTGTNMIVEVIGGEVVDLGKLEYSGLPE